MNPDQTAPKGEVWSGSILFAIQATKVHGLYLFPFSSFSKKTCESHLLTNISHAMSSLIYRFGIKYQVLFIDLLSNIKSYLSICYQISSLIYRFAIKYQVLFIDLLSNIKSYLLIWYQISSLIYLPKTAIKFFLTYLLRIVKQVWQYPSKTTGSQYKNVHQ